MSMPSGEVNTGPVVRDAFKKGKEVYIPYIYQYEAGENSRKRSSMDMLQLRDIEDYEALHPDKWGIPSLDASSIEQRRNWAGGNGATNGRLLENNSRQLDMVLVPAVAFDVTLNRLGHGKGYYDDFLRRYFSSSDASVKRGTKPYLGTLFPPKRHACNFPKLSVVGLALRDQLLPEGQTVPTESWDHPVDIVIAGDAVCRGRRSRPFATEAILSGCQ